MRETPEKGTARPGPRRLVATSRTDSLGNFGGSRLLIAARAFFLKEEGARSSIRRGGMKEIGQRSGSCPLPSFFLVGSQDSLDAAVGHEPHHGDEHIKSTGQPWRGEADENRNRVEDE
jgi:hypothetical protein